LKRKIGSIRPGANRPEKFGLEPWPIVWGVYVGQGCITGKDPLDWIHILAHAHNRKDEEYFGWICIRDAKMAFTKLGNPSLVMKHEVAHLIANDQGHTKKWREVLTQMGGASEAKKYLISKKKPTILNNKVIESKEENGKRVDAPREETLGRLWSPGRGPGEYSGIGLQAQGQEPGRCTTEVYVDW